MSTDEKIIVYVVCLIGVCLIAGFLDSAARVVRWGRRRKPLPAPVADPRDWQTKFYTEHGL